MKYWLILIWIECDSTISPHLCITTKGQRSHICGKLFLSSVVPLVVKGAHTQLNRCVKVLNKLCKILHNPCETYEPTNSCVKSNTTPVVSNFKQQMCIFLHNISLKKINQLGWVNSFTQYCLKKQFNQPGCVSFCTIVVKQAIGL